VPQDFQDVVNEYYRSASDGSACSALVVSFHYRVTNLFARSKALLRSTSDRVKGTLDLLQEGEDLAECARGWSELEDGWRAMRVTSVPGPASRRTWMPHKTHSKYYYASIFVYLHWFRYNLARVKLHEVMLDCLNALHLHEVTSYQHRIQARIEYHRDQVQAGLADFLGGVAFALGDIDERGEFCCEMERLPYEADGLATINASGAQRLIIPLYILRHSKYLTAVQCEGIEAALLRIGQELNYPWTCPSQSRPS
jgi:hypothetical protein